MSPYYLLIIQALQIKAEDKKTGNFFNSKSQCHIQPWFRNKRTSCKLEAKNSQNIFRTTPKIQPQFRKRRDQHKP